jgi:hypothetical protein
LKPLVIPENCCGNILYHKANFLLSSLLVTFQLTFFSRDNKPKVTYQVGKAKVTLWETERNGKYEKFLDKNFNIEKIYKKDDKWESTNSFNLTELIQLRTAIDKAISKEGVIIIGVEDKKEFVTKKNENKINCLQQWLLIHASEACPRQTCLCLQAGSLQANALTNLPARQA